jgi:hypothetical protein
MAALLWLLRSQYGPNWKREASDKLRSAHSAFALELNLQQQESSFPTGNQDAAISDPLGGTCFSRDTMDWQSTMDLEFLHRILMVSDQRKRPGPRVHRADQSVKIPTIPRPINPPGFPFKLSSVSRL